MTAANGRRPRWAINTSAEVISRSAAETMALGEALGRGARAGDVILLEGPIGAGKTVLVQGIAAGLDAVADVVSPTFVLVRQYAGRLAIVHADLYRLEGREEIGALGLLELAEPGLLVIEWSDRAPWLAAPERLSLRLEPTAEAEWRRLSLPAIGPRHLLDAVAAAASSG